MKLLKIKNFTKVCMDIESKDFTIKYCTDAGDKYVLGIDSIPIRYGPNIHYKLAIHKEESEGSYHIWIWNMEKNISYPMNIYKRDLESISTFITFLTNVLGLANEDTFSGVSGNRITFK